MYRRRGEAKTLRHEMTVCVDTSSVRVTCVGNENGHIELLFSTERIIPTNLPTNTEGWLLAMSDVAQLATRECGIPSRVTVIWSPTYAHTFLRGITSSWDKSKVVTKAALDALLVQDEKALKKELSQQFDESFQLLDRRTIGIEIGGYPVIKLPRTKTTSVWLGTLVSISSKEAVKKATSVISRSIGAKVPIVHHSADVLGLLTARSIRGPEALILVTVYDDTTTIAVCDSAAVPRTIRHIKGGSQSLQTLLAEAFPQHTPALRDALLMGHQKALLLSAVTDRVESVLSAWGTSTSQTIVKALEKIPHDAAAESQIVVAAPISVGDTLVKDLSLRRGRTAETPLSFAGSVLGAHRARHGMDILASVWPAVERYEN